MNEIPNEYASGQPATPSEPLSPERLAEIRTVAQHAVDHPTVIVGSTNGSLSSATRLGRHALDLLAEVDRLTADVAFRQQQISELIDQRETGHRRERDLADAYDAALVVLAEYREVVAGVLWMVQAFAEGGGTRSKEMKQYQRLGALLNRQPITERGSAILAAANRFADELAYVLEAHSNATRFHNALKVWRELAAGRAS